jgi:hypothetical protein
MYRIPPMLDFDMILRDLKTCGWADQKLEICLGLAPGFIYKLRAGQINRVSLVTASRIHNLWADEIEALAHTPTQVATTT